MNLQSIIKPVFSFLWRNRLEIQKYKLIKVTGWRSCIIDTNCGQRMRVTFMTLLPMFRKPRYLRGNTEAYNYLDTSNYRPKDPNDTSTYRT